MLTHLLPFAAGLAALVAGAEMLVRGSSKLARSWGVAPLVIGLTIVAFGTSTPELAVSVKATLAGQADLSVGNVVGSNICNVLLILGVCALAAPLRVALQLVRSDVWIMVAASVVVWGLAMNGEISRAEGLLLTAGLVLYTWHAVREEQRQSKTEPSEQKLEQPRKSGASWTEHWAVNIGSALAGLALLIQGSEWLIDAALALGRELGAGELILGLTVVAVGTSLPELATSFIATLRGERDIAVGNIVGSNIFNLLGVLGISAALSPIPVQVAESALRFDIPVMTAVAAACLPIFFTGYRIDRWEGGLFLGYYIAYVAYLVLDATSPQALRPFTVAMLGFVIPITVATLGIIVVRSWRRDRERPHGDEDGTGRSDV